MILGDIALTTVNGVIKRGGENKAGPYAGVALALATCQKRNWLQISGISNEISFEMLIAVGALELQGRVWGYGSW